MKSLRSVVENAIEEFRLRTKVLAVLDNPEASLENRAAAIEIVLTGNPDFWLAVAKRMYRKPVSIPAPVPAVQVVKPAAPALAPAPAPVPQSRPVVTTAPARTLQKPNPDELFKTWLGHLRAIISGKNMPWPSVQSLTTRIFATMIGKLTQDHWQLFFEAVKAANSRKNPQHIITRDAKPAKIFAAAPVELIDDYLFGHEGIVPSLTGEIVDCSGELSLCLQAKASIVLDAVEALDTRTQNGLAEQEERLVGKLLDAIEVKNAPDWLIEKGKSVWGNSEDTPDSSPAANGNGNGHSDLPSAGGLHIVGDLNSLVHLPVTNMAAAKAVSAEFLAAASSN